MAKTVQKAIEEANKLDEAIAKAEKFCKAMKAEKEIRDFIADITAKLNRSNLSADEGKRYALRLFDAFQHLKELEEGVARGQFDVSQSESGFGKGSGPGPIGEKTSSN